jgi:methyl acetate hydrolase
MSMTKLVVTIAALQLLDAGKVSLDDPELITKHLPELVKLDILRAVTDGVPAYTKRTKPITLRHLLTHTSGLGYDIMVPMLGEWVAATGAPASFAKNPTVKSFEHPLLFEPGTAWNYSLGLDWAGVLVERITGQTLEQYFQDNIFKPVGAKTLTFTPTPVHYERLQAVTARTEDLKLVVFPGIRDTSPEAIVGQASGGAGLYGTARDYLRVLQGVLASAQPGGLVSPESYKLIFSDQLPKAGEDKFAGQLGFAQLIPHIHPSLVENKQIRHSLGGFLSTADSPVGRKAYSDWWEGIYKTFYWMDPTTGVAVSSRCMLCVGS